MELPVLECPLLYLRGYVKDDQEKVGLGLKCSGVREEGDHLGLTVQTSNKASLLMPAVRYRTRLKSTTIHTKSTSTMCCSE